MARHIRIRQPDSPPTAAQPDQFRLGRCPGEKRPGRLMVVAIETLQESDMSHFSSPLGAAALACVPASNGATSRHSVSALPVRCLFRGWCHAGDRTDAQRCTYGRGCLAARDVEEDHARQGVPEPGRNGFGRESRPRLDHRPIRGATRSGHTPSYPARWSGRCRRPRPGHRCCPAHVRRRRHADRQRGLDSTHGAARRRLHDCRRG